MPAERLASEAIVDLYERNARGWLEDRGTDLHERVWLDRFLAPLAAGGEILDIGCGTGEPIGRYLLDQGFRLTGIDSSPALVAIAAERLPAGRWLVRDMRALTMEQGFDGLLAWNSFFHLTPSDQRTMFPIFAALARPGAMLMFTSGSEHGEAIGSWRGEPLYHGSLDPDEYRALLAANGFALMDQRINDPECGDGTIWLARAQIRKGRRRFPGSGPSRRMRDPIGAKS